MRDKIHIPGQQTHCLVYSTPHAYKYNNICVPSVILVKGCTSRWSVISVKQAKQSRDWEFQFIPPNNTTLYTTPTHLTVHVQFPDLTSWSCLHLIYSDTSSVQPNFPLPLIPSSKRSNPIGPLFLTTVIAKDIKSHCTYLSNTNIRLS